MSTITTKKVLIPLATAALAGALAIGSGADFASSTSNTAGKVTSGTLTQSNSKAGAEILKLDNMKPGDSVQGQVVITNTGSLDSIFSVTQTSTTDFPANVLTEKIEDITNATGIKSVYSGPFTAGSLKQDLSTWAPNEARTYRFTVTLAKSADNASQGKTATASFAWNGTQGAPTVTDVDAKTVTPAP